MRTENQTNFPRRDGPDTRTYPHTDVLIVGCGLAGLYAALHIDSRLSVLFVTKERMDGSSSWLAQGGIAAAVAAGDTPAVHGEDTMIAGAGLCDAEAVRVLADEGPDDIRRLVEMKVPFDLGEDGGLAITREGGHTRNRVVHAGGDATGRETVRVLARLAAERSNISVLRDCFASDILIKDGAACGVAALLGGERARISAGAVVLATGGLGQIYSNTTNPPVATGDGIALALRAGAELRNMEFVQFHPTGLYTPRGGGQRAFLISEAVRGEGAVLRSKAGERFMDGLHPMAELAPRDIVSRCIVSEMERSGEPCVYLDATAIPEDRLKRRFPTIYAECAARGIDIAKNWIPVCPVQHYQVGGVRADLNARTTLPGLFAVGEVSCTGVHGANRLASNSMLECLVFGRRAAQYINGMTMGTAVPGGLPEAREAAPADGTDEIKDRIRSVCDKYAGVVRTAGGLEQGLREMESILSEMPESYTRDRLETRNMAMSARAILSAALARKESVGTHYIKSCSIGS